MADPVEERAATARPWKSGEWSGVVGTAITAQPDPTMNTEIVALVRSRPADARLIVEAVNAHDTLFHALRRIAEPYPDGGYSGDRHAKCMEIARSALASLTPTPSGGTNDGC